MRLGRLLRLGKFAICTSTAKFIGNFEPLKGKCPPRSSHYRNRNCTTFLWPVGLFSHFLERKPDCMSFVPLCNSDANDSLTVPIQNGTFLSRREPSDLLLNIKFFYCLKFLLVASREQTIITAASSLRRLMRETHTMARHLQLLFTVAQFALFGMREESPMLTRL